MFKKNTLYTIIYIVLFNFVSACTSIPPVQDISETRQKIDIAEEYAKTDADKANIELANSYLQQAINAISNDNIDAAEELLKQSKIEANKIIDEYTKQPNSNIKFRY